MNASAPRHPRRLQSGVALLDALVGLMIFAFGVLGVMGLQASLTKAQGGAKFRADAANLSNELLGLMWGDAPGNLTRYASSTCAAHAPCKDWSDKVRKSLPSATTTVAVNLVALPAGAATTIADVSVTLTWEVPGEGVHSYQASTRVQP